MRTTPDEHGDRTGFKGRRYKTRLLDESSYRDQFDDYLAFLAPRLEEAHRLLKNTGTLYFHIDYREAHYCKLLLDEIFGRERFLNEIIWAYDYGARAKRSWPKKHDTILVYVKDPKKYFFDSEEVDREPYMAPGLVTAEKAARGKLPTDVWWHTIVPTNGHEKTGYPTQKPEGIVRRMVQASTRKGDWCLDFFAGSGTLGAVAARLGRRYVLIDSNPEAVRGNACPSWVNPRSARAAGLRAPSRAARRRPASGSGATPTSGSRGSERAALALTFTAAAARYWLSVYPHVLREARHWRGRAEADPRRGAAPPGAEHAAPGAGQPRRCRGVRGAGAAPAARARGACGGGVPGDLRLRGHARRAAERGPGRERAAAASRAAERA